MKRIFAIYKIWKFDATPLQMTFLTSFTLFISKFHFFSWFVIPCVHCSFLIPYFENVYGTKYKIWQVTLHYKYNIPLFQTAEKSHVYTVKVVIIEYKIDDFPMAKHVWVVTVTVNYYIRSNTISFNDAISITSSQIQRCSTPMVDQ